MVRQAEPGVGEEELRERFAELDKDDDRRVELAELHAHQRPPPLDVMTTAENGNRRLV